jgi:hypothetical protein
MRICIIIVIVVTFKGTTIIIIMITIKINRKQSTIDNQLIKS